MTKTNKSKIEIDGSSSSDEEDVIVLKRVKDECYEGIKDDEIEPINIKEEVIKEKKPRTQKQIDATNNMRLKLNEKRDNVKQEKDEFKKQVKSKIKKDKIQKKVISKLREIIDEDESEEEIEYEKPIKKIIVKEPLKNLIKFF